MLGRKNEDVESFETGERKERRTSVVLKGVEGQFLLEGRERRFSAVKRSKEREERDVPV